MDAQIELASLQAEHLKAEQEGDVQQMDRLATQIKLQEQLADLVSNTTAQQILAADKIQSELIDLVEGLKSGVSDLFTDWEGGVKKIKNAMAEWLTSFLQRQAGNLITNLVPGFAGFFAEGGRIPAGQWGVVGEDGPEKVYAGASGLSVSSNEESFGGGSGGFYIDARGAGPREVDELRRMFENMDANFNRRVVHASNQGLMRGKIQPPSFTGD